MLQEASYSWYYYKDMLNIILLQQERNPYQNHRPHSTTQQQMAWKCQGSTVTATASQRKPAIPLPRVSSPVIKLTAGFVVSSGQNRVFCLIFLCEGKEKIRPFDRKVLLSFLAHVRNRPPINFFPKTRLPRALLRCFVVGFCCFGPFCVLVAAAMDDVKDKMKGFMKNPFSSSSSGKFKGQGRVLGSSSSGPTNPNYSRPPLQSSSAAAAAAAAASRLPNVKSAQPKRPAIPDEKNPSFGGNQERNREPGTGFDPFDSLVTSSKRSQNGYTLNVVECPICNWGFKSEDEVSEHVDSCVGDGNDSVTVADRPDTLAEGNCDLESCVGAFLSGKPSEGSLDVVLKLYRNIVRDPDNPKFRKIRMSNPKIREAVGDVASGIELLENVGFELKEEDGEMWAVMEVPGKDQLDLIGDTIMLLEPEKLEKPTMAGNAAPADSSVEDRPMEPKSVDRRIKVFFSVPESVAARIELPDSIYSLSIDDVKREADLRRKKIADSQLLMPKSYREKQMRAGRKRYNRTMIRVQFPDGVVLQGVFAPWEPTTALYEFVSTALKEPCLEFELIHPVVVKRRVIPHWSSPGERAVTLDDEDLVPSALIKFRPIETDTVVFTGLKNELLEIIEPLQ